MLELSLKQARRESRAGKIRFAQVPERVSTKSFVGLMIGKLQVESLRRTGHREPRFISLLFLLGDA